jgi:hypothetical protein
MNDKVKTRILTRIDGLIIEPFSEALLKYFGLKNHDSQINCESDDYQTQKT